MTNSITVTLPVEGPNEDGKYRIPGFSYMTAGAARQTAHLLGRRNRPVESQAVRALADFIALKEAEAAFEVPEVGRWIRATRRDGEVVTGEVMEAYEATFHWEIGLKDYRHPLWLNKPHQEDRNENAADITAWEYVEPEPAITPEKMLAMADELEAVMEKFREFIGGGSK